MTPVERGFRFFKKSFLENPWDALERDMAKTMENKEEIEIQLDDDEETEQVEATDGPEQVDTGENAIAEKSIPSTDA